MTFSVINDGFSNESEDTPDGPPQEPDINILPTI